MRVRTFARACAAFALAAATVGGVALADPGGTLAAAANGANAAIKNALTVHLPDGTVAQVPPVTQNPVGANAQAAGLPTGSSQITTKCSTIRSTSTSGKCRCIFPRVFHRLQSIRAAST